MTYIPLFYNVAPNPINATSINTEKINNSDVRITWKVRTCIIADWNVYYNEFTL